MPEPAPRARRAARPVAVLRCADCGALDPGPREICPACHGERLEPAEVAGEGALVSWTMIRRPPLAFREEGEYAVAVIRLAAGLTVTGRLAAPHATIAPGRPVRCAGEVNGVPLFEEAG